MQASFQRGGALKGTVSVPGDKSISHRVAIIGAMARGESRVRGFSPAEDCASTLAVLRALGVDVTRDGETLLIEGIARKGFLQPDGPLYAGNSGTTMRLLSGALASSRVTVTLRGDESLERRPMGRIIEPLRLMGATITAGENGRPPLRIEGGSLHGIDYSPIVPSAQVKSAVLIAGLGASGRTLVKESVLTRDHTERLLEYTGIAVYREGLKVAVDPGVPEAREIVVPGDASSAAFLVGAALLCPGSEVIVRSVGLNPTRTGFIDLFRRMGADIETVQTDSGDWEPVGDIIARHGALKGIRVSAEDVALAIDEITLLALLASRADGTTEISGALELRHKESDRIAGTVAALRELGARIEETDDGMVIEGPSELKGSHVHASRDHRLAMMLALAGLVAGGETVVEGWEWTQISYPGFEKVLSELGSGRSHE